MTTTALILNGILAVALLAALGQVMSLGHRLAGSRSRTPADWRAPDEPERVERTAEAGDLKRAA